MAGPQSVLAAALPAGLMAALPELTRTNIVIGLGCALAALLVVTYILLFPYPESRISSEFRNLPGPSRGSWIAGNMGEILMSEPGSMTEKWEAEYGSTIRITQLGGLPVLSTSDIAAVSYIVQNGYEFEKPDNASALLASILGDGLIIAEGAQHRRQRRVLNPAFGPTMVKSYIPLFLDKAYQLQQKWSAMIEGTDKEPGALTPAEAQDMADGALKIDVLNGLNKVTLDILGLAGFDVDFDSLGGDHELAKAYRDMGAVSHKLDPLLFAEISLPILKLIPSKRRRTVAAAHATANRYGKGLVAEAKRRVEAEKSGESKEVSKDLLSLLIRANTSDELRDDQRLSDREVFAQMTTFMFAGHETTSNSLAFTLQRLASRPDIQDKLYSELQTVSDHPDFDTLSALPYLDQVIREVLRLDGPVTELTREATKDTVLPLKKPVTLRNGGTVTEIPLRKGDYLFFSLHSMNRSEAVWGPDAKEFNPDRYNTAALDKVPGVWGNIMSFFGGARNCIGYRFAIVEMKALLFVLIRSFEFVTLPSDPKVKREWMIVQRPILVGQENLGPQLPLLVRPRVANL